MMTGENRTQLYNERVKAVRRQKRAIFGEASPPSLTKMEQTTSRP